MKSFGFQWHLSDRCNLSCAHCYQGRFDGSRELPARDLAAMARRIFEGVRDRCVSVNLTGGEPLIHPHLVDLLDVLHGIPNLEEVNIITNGTVTSAPLLERLAGFPKLGCLKISCESADPEINDSIRGRGHFARFVKNLEIYRERLARPIVLMTTLARYNLEGIPNIVHLAREHRLAGVIFERFVPLGQGLGLQNEVLTAQNWSRALELVLEQAESDADAEDLFAFRAFWLGTGTDNLGELSGALCNLGDESMALMPDGSVYPCRRLPICVGNLKHDRFGSVLQKLKEFSVSSSTPRLTGPLCRTCGVKECAGCRALAFALTGDALADDPQCPLAENSLGACQ